MKVAIVGSRNYPELEKVREYIRKLSPDDIIVSGGAKGVDQTAEDEARKLGMEVISVPAEWNKYGRRAGLMRNDLIVEMEDFSSCFLGRGQSWDKIHD